MGPGLTPSQVTEWGPISTPEHGHGPDPNPDPVPVGVHGAQPTTHEPGDRMGLDPTPIPPKELDEPLPTCTYAGQQGRGS